MDSPHLRPQRQRLVPARRLPPDPLAGKGHRRPRHPDANAGLVDDALVAAQLHGVLGHVRGGERKDAQRRPHHLAVLRQGL